MSKEVANIGKKFDGKIKNLKLNVINLEIKKRQRMIKRLTSEIEYLENKKLN